MPPPTIADGVQVTVTYRLQNGDVAQNVLNYQGSDSLDAAGASAINDAFDTAYSTDLRGVISNDVTFLRVRVTDLSFAPYTEYVYDHSTAGNNTNANLPTQVAAVVSLHTGIGGRSGRGRIYIGGMTVDALADQGTLTNTYRTAVLAWATDVSVITHSGVTWQLGVFSRKLVEINPVTLFTMDNRADTQRRRANIRIP